MSDNKEIAAHLEGIHITLKDLLAMLQVWHDGKPRSTEQDAIAALLVVGPKMKEIVARTGLHKSTLYRMKKFMTFYRKAQGPVRAPRRGYRTTEGIEAVEESEE